MKHTLSTEKRAALAAALSGFFLSEFEEQLSEFRANEIVEFLIKEIGPAQYNKGIADAHKFISDKLEDLDAEFYQTE
ncbi:MAG: hypothetical protein DHS20C08_16590 [Rhodomicrobium sp.]|nr:MAG: hypothetical protein DHS20C08_16590 [Rhodomicrobium sp.]